jgi:hypothetical protein
MNGDGVDGAADKLDSGALRRYLGKKNKCLSTDIGEVGNREGE